MANKQLKYSLNNLDELVKELNKYADSLAEKRNIFVRALMEEGISVAIAQYGEYAGMIKFEKIIDEKGGLIIASDGQKLVKTWYTDKALTNERSYEVSPLLLAEFGSGWLAKVYGFDLKGKVGQGTMPEQKHAFDTNGWYWYDEDGTMHHSYGEEPKHPLYYATIEMELQINKIAKEVFG